MNTEQQNNSNYSQSEKQLGWVSKFSWLLFLQGTISFQGWGWEVKLQYQPLLENRIFTELVESINSTEKSIK
ncbi:MAG: hypothetical protein AAFQ80_02370 [Cyanobacteria bacterium J06621_8]